MKSIFSIFFILFCIVNVANAEPPSIQSIKRLLEISNAKAMYDAQYQQMMPMIKNSLQKSLPEGSQKEEAIKKIDKLMPKVESILKSELSWSILEPEYIKIYSNVFTQEEIYGIITFYESPVGASMLKKTPLAMQQSMAILSERMPSIMKKVVALAEEKKE